MRRQSRHARQAWALARGCKVRRRVERSHDTCAPGLQHSTRISPKPYIPLSVAVERRCGRRSFRFFNTVRSDASRLLRRSLGPCFSRRGAHARPEPASPRGVGRTRPPYAMCAHTRAQKYLFQETPEQRRARIIVDLKDCRRRSQPHQGLPCRCGRTKPSCCVG